MYDRKRRVLVGTVPGEAFYLSGPGRPYVRACFSLPDDVIDVAVSRLVGGCGSWSRM